jgi:hypothetical protein
MKIPKYFIITTIILLLLCFYLAYNNYQLNTKLNNTDLKYSQKFDSVKIHLSNIRAAIDDNESNISKLENKIVDLDNRASNIEEFLGN